MTEDIKIEALRFLNQYFNNAEIDSEAFLTAVQHKAAEFSNIEQQEIFIRSLIEAGRFIKEEAKAALKKHETYKLTGNE